MNLLNLALLATSLVAAGWWALARHHRPQALQALSVSTVLLAAITLLTNGPQYVAVPWMVVGVGVGIAGALRHLRPGSSRRWSRVLGRSALVVGCLIGALAALPAFVPDLPAPAGPHRVASAIFRWTDDSRPETLTTDPTDRRQVIAQAWYPTDAAEGQSMPYYEAQDRLPGSIAGLPRFMFAGFSQVDTHAIVGAPASDARRTWPVLVFTPGLSVPREWFAGLSADLASRGYVVLAMSASYESPVTVLEGGQVADQRANPDVTGPPPHPEVQRLIDLRVDDIRFALDQLEQIQRGESSPLSGHLDLDRIGIVGHSIGGASAVQAMAADPRLKTGVNLDGKLFGAQPDSDLRRRFLWIESGDAKTAEYSDGRDRLMRHLGRNGAVLQLPGSTHMSFSDAPAFWTAPGRRVFGSLAAIGSPTTAVRTADAIDPFVRGTFAGKPALAPVSSQRDCPEKGAGASSGSCPDVGNPGSRQPAITNQIHPPVRSTAGAKQS